MWSHLSTNAGIVSLYSRARIIFWPGFSHQISSIFIKLRIDSTQIVLDPSCMALKGINCADLVIRNHVTDI